jgi:hypothetical protein
MLEVRIAGSWSVAGDACDDAGALDGMCVSPTALLGCDPATNRCARVCESYRDCLDLVPPLDFGAPRLNARVCE